MVLEKENSLNISLVLDVMESRNTTRLEMLDMLKDMHFEERVMIKTPKVLLTPIEFVVNKDLLKECIPDRITSSREILEKGLSVAPSGEEYRDALNEAWHFLKAATFNDPNWHDFNKILMHLSQSYYLSWAK